MSLTADAVVDLSASECATAWLVLLTISHPQMAQAIRLTSDGVQTVSNGKTYTAYPFEVILPEDVEGRSPQASLKVDNTSQEIIAALRQMQSPPSVDIQIVRSADPNVVERRWSGLIWRVARYDVGSITGTLSIDDTATEEFPYVTFDGRFKGLWP